MNPQHLTLSRTSRGRSFEFSAGDEQVAWVRLKRKGCGRFSQRRFRPLTWRDLVGFVEFIS